MNFKPERSPIGFSPCDLLEASWNGSGARLDLPMLLETFPPNSLDPQLRLELAEVDLEWRWRCQCPERTPLPRSWYIQFLELDAAASERLAKRELSVRSRWGDSPTILQIADGLVDSQRCEREFATLLSKKFPIQVRVLREEALILQTRLPSISTWGRQSSKEPLAPATIPLEHRTRFIVANQHENQISRCQFSLQRLSARSVEINTAGASVPTYCHGKQLLPGARAIASFPLILNADVWSVRLEYCS